ncbi:MAG: hypothetical protein LBR08_00605 [Bacteroidales bacterium]|jgi:hypothetical protein|nr:hypothetical protein [Bacteroidales bacterium]
MKTVAILFFSLLPCLAPAQTGGGAAQADAACRVIHVFVALCDNRYQGIVPVPAKIGNGQDPGNNLYWGCGYGVRTYFGKSREWKLIRTQKQDSIRMERLIFKHALKDVYLVADAYNGRYIRQCTQDFLSAAAGLRTDTLHVDRRVVGISGHAQLIAYAGHDGLMDFRLAETYRNTDGRQRDVIILACYSKRFFAPHLSAANVRPLVWTTGLMCPEAYTLHDALTGYVNRETSEGIRTRAAAAYAQYQKCSQKAARNLLVTGW